MTSWAGRAVRLPFPGKEYAAAAGGIAALVLFLFRDAAFGGQVLYLRDINMVWLPLAESFVRCVLSGAWPLWDPHGGFGRPLLADPRAEVLYPITWLNLIAPAWSFYTWFVVGHLVLSGVGFYAVCRRLAVSAPGSFVGAAVWTGSGPLLSLASVWHHLAAAAWIPWVFLAGERALESGSTRHALLWAAAIAAQILAGSPEISLLTAILLGLRILTCGIRWRAPRHPDNRRRLAASGMALVFALGLSAAQWLPSLEVAGRSARWSLTFQERTTWSLNPWGLLEVMLPVRISELPPSSRDESVVRELHVPWLQSPYLGIPAFALVAAALLARSPRDRFWWLLAAGALLFALGRHTFVYSLAVSLAPPLRLLRYPVKAMLVVSFCWSVLAARGLDAWRARDGQTTGRSQLWLAGAIVVLSVLCGCGALLATAGSGSLGPVLWPGLGPSAYAAILASTGERLAIGACLAGAVSAFAVSRAVRPGRRVWIPGALGLLVIADLLAAHRNLHPVAPREMFTRRPVEVLEQLQKQGYPRIYVYDYSMSSRAQSAKGPGWMKGYPIRRGPPGWSASQALVLGVHSYLNPPTGARWGLYGSYDLNIAGLDPAPATELAELLRDVEDTPAHLRLLRLGAVANVVAFHPAPWWQELVLHATLPGPFAEPIRVFEVPDPLPRTYVVDGVRTADGPSALQTLTAADFVPERELILPSGEASPPGPSSAGSSRIVEMKADRVRLEADLERAGYVVLVDAYDPGWSATVDGAPAPVLRANVAFRAIRLPAGRHTVELVYGPGSVKWGMAISVLTLALWLLLLASRTRPAPRAA